MKSTPSHDHKSRIIQQISSPVHVIYRYKADCTIESRIFECGSKSQVLNANFHSK